MISTCCSKKKVQRFDPDQTLIVAPDLCEWLLEDHLCHIVAEIV